MPQLAAITIKDGKATPADHVFAPRDIVSGVAALTEGTGSPISDNSLTVSSTRTNAGRRNVKIKLTLPIVQMATVNGVTRPTVVRVAYAEASFSFSEESATAERKDSRALLLNALNNALIGSTVDDLSALY